MNSEKQSRELYVLARVSTSTMLKKKLSGPRKDKEE